MHSSSANEFAIRKSQKGKCSPTHFWMARNNGFARSACLKTSWTRGVDVQLDVGDGNGLAANGCSFTPIHLALARRRFLFGVFVSHWLIQKAGLFKHKMRANPTPSPFLLVHPHIKVPSIKSPGVYIRHLTQGNPFIALPKHPNSPDISPDPAVTARDTAESVNTRFPPKVDGAMITAIIQVVG